LCAEVRAAAFTNCCDPKPANRQIWLDCVNDRLDDYLLDFDERGVCGLDIKVMLVLGMGCIANLPEGAPCGGGSIPPIQPI